MVERPLCMREVLGSYPDSPLFFFELNVFAAMCVRKKKNSINNYK